MTLNWITSPDSRVIDFNGTIRYEDLAKIRFDHVERLMMREPIETAADFLLLAEMLFRRMAEQAERPSA